jgi:hypothetical protein
MPNHYISAGPAISFNRAKQLLAASPIWTVVCPDDETIWAWCAPADDWISLYCNRPFNSDELLRVTFCDEDGFPLPDQAKARAEYLPRPHGEDPVKTETVGPFEWLEETLQTQFLDIYGPRPAQSSAWDDSSLIPYAELPEHESDEGSEWKKVHDYIEETKDMSRDEYERLANQENPHYQEQRQAFFAGMEKRRKFIESIPDVTKEDYDAFLEELESLAGSQQNEQKDQSFPSPP